MARREFGRRLRSHREGAGLTHQDVARATNRSVKQVYDWEAGRGFPQCMFGAITAVGSTPGEFFAGFPVFKRTG